MRFELWFIELQTVINVTNITNFIVLTIKFDSSQFVFFYISLPNKFCLKPLLRKTAATRSNIFVFYAFTSKCIFGWFILSEINRVYSIYLVQIAKHIYAYNENKFIPKTILIKVFSKICEHKFCIKWHECESQLHHSEIKENLYNIKLYFTFHALILTLNIKKCTSHKSKNIHKCYIDWLSK